MGSSEANARYRAKNREELRKKNREYARNRSDEAREYTNLKGDGPVNQKEIEIWNKNNPELHRAQTAMCHIILDSLGIGKGFFSR